MSTAEFVAVTSQSRSKRHWSLAKKAQWRFSPLCGSTPWAFDQGQIDRGARKRVVIEDLPPCKQCDKSRQRRIDGRSS